MFKTYFPSDQEHYWDGFDDSYQLIVFDDFRGTMKLSSILKLLDGQHMRLPQRYNSFLKTKNIPIVVSTNLPPHAVYRVSAYSQDVAFETRFKVIKVETFINIFQ